MKIIQSGVKEVVYHLGYKVYVPSRFLFGAHAKVTYPPSYTVYENRDEASAGLFREAGVTIRRHAPPDPL